MHFSTSDEDFQKKLLYGKYLSLYTKLMNKEDWQSMK